MAEEIISNKIRREETGYKYSLHFKELMCGEALMNLGTATSLDHLNSLMNIAMSTLDTLEDALTPYHDKEFTDARKEYSKLDIPSNEDYKKQNPNVEVDKIDDHIQAIRLNKLRDIQRKRYACMMCLMDRKNLLLEEEIEDEIGGKKK